jgi:hypothetical protein
MASAIDPAVTYPTDETDYNWLISDWEPGDNLWINVQGTYTVEYHPQGFIGVQLRHVCETLPANQKSFAVIRSESGTALEELTESPMIIPPNAGQFRRSPLPTGRLEFSSAHLGQEFIIKYVSSGNVNSVSYGEDQDLQAYLKRILYKSSWRPSYLDGSTNWIDMAFGVAPFGMFILVGIDVSKLYYKRGGNVWTAAATESVNRRWQGVAFGNSVCVVVGDGATAASTSCIMSSNNPTASWTTRTAPEARDYTAVAFGANKFVAISYGDAAGIVITSNATGSSWTSRTGHSGNWEDITFGNDIFVVVGAGDSGKKVMTSPDGITWTERDAPPLDTVWTKVAFGNGVFIAIDSFFPDENSQRIMRSTDGINWTVITHDAIAVGSSGSNIAYGNGVWQIAWAGSTVNTFASFDNGLTWETGMVNTLFSGTNIPIAFGYGRFEVARVGDLDFGGLQTLAVAETV